MAASTTREEACKCDACHAPACSICTATATATKSGPVVTTTHRLEPSMKLYHHNLPACEGWAEARGEHACVLGWRAHLGERAHLPQLPRSRSLVEIDQLGHQPASPATIWWTVDPRSPSARSLSRNSQDLCSRCSSSSSTCDCAWRRSICMRAEQLPAQEPRCVEIQRIAGCSQRSNAPAFFGGRTGQIL